MNRVVTGLALAAFIAAFVCYYLLSPSQVDKRKAQELFNGLENTLETQNRQQVVNALDSALASDAQVALKIGFPALPGQKSREVETENFSRAEFLHFVDNTLYTLTDYHFTGNVRSIELNNDSRIGVVELLGRAQAAGTQMDGNMHFSDDLLCKAGMRFDKDKPPQILKLSCVMQLRYAASPQH